MPPRQHQEKKTTLPAHFLRHIWHYYRYAKVTPLYMDIFIFTVRLGAVIDTYVKVTNEGLEPIRYWNTSAESYSWNDIRDVEIHQDEYICDNCGGEHQKVKARVTFSDGTLWKPATDSACAFTQTKIVDAIQYVAERSGN